MVILLRLLHGGDFQNSVLRQRYMDNENYDWKSSVLRTGQQQNHFISASGSTEKTTYRLGLGYQSEENVFKNNDYWRVNIKGAFDSKLSKVVEAGMSVNLAHDVVNVGLPILRQIILLIIMRSGSRLSFLLTMKTGHWLRFPEKLEISLSRQCLIRLLTLK